MPAEIRIFLNDRGQLVPPGTSVRDAIRTALPDLLSACETGEAFVTDGRGLPVALDALLHAGAILRTARVSRRGAGKPPDSHA
jgi:hypothetical protein